MISKNQHNSNFLQLQMDQKKINKSLNRVSNLQASKMNDYFKNQPIAIKKDKFKEAQKYQEMLQKQILERQRLKKIAEAMTPFEMMYNKE